MTVVVESSPLESNRFGLRIGRCVVAGVDQLDGLVAACEGFDVVVLRYPAEEVGVSFLLAGLQGFRCLSADHLCFWEWAGDRPPRHGLPLGWTIDTSPGYGDVVDVVRDSFAGYTNHYSANPLLDPAAALDGYAEWAQRLTAEDADAAVVLRDPAGTAAGVALVDWHADPPDIRLAGMRTSAQGRGLYRVLVASVMGLVLRRGANRVQISTQSHNVMVMRAWARLGFLPARTVATAHLVREEFLAPGEDRYGPVQENSA